MSRDDKQELTFRRGLPYSWQGFSRASNAVSGDLRFFMRCPFHQTHQKCQHCFAIVPRPIGTQDPLFLSSFQQGEEIAFDCLFREYFTSLTYFANRYIADAQAAEDMVQDCFVLLWQRRERLQHVSLIKSYLYTTVRNQCLKQLEKNRRQQLNLNSPTEEPSFEETLIASETANQLYQLIDTLTPALQKIIRLYYLEGKSNHEIAKELHIEPDTVIRQRLRGILALRKTKISL